MQVCRISLLVKVLLVISLQAVASMFKQASMQHGLVPINVPIVYIST